jgi:hypothetical protein
VIFLGKLAFDFGRGWLALPIKRPARREAHQHERQKADD